MTLAGFAMMDDVYPRPPSAQQSHTFPVAESMPRAPPPKRRKKRRPRPAPPPPTPTPAPASTLTSTLTKDPSWLAIILLLLVVLLLLLALVKVVSLNQHLSSLLMAQSYMRPTFLAPR